MNNVSWSRSSRTAAITELIKNPDVITLSTYLNNAFTRYPSLAHVNFMILTLVQISEDATISWKKFASLLSPCYEYIRDWKKNDKSLRLYEKVILEMLPIIDCAYMLKG